MQVTATRTLSASVIRTVAINMGYRIMKMIWGILTLVIGLTFIPTAKAAGTTDTLILEDSVNWLKLVRGREVRVYIRDRVDDGCWTNITAVKTAVELELKRSGFKIEDDGTTRPVFIILESIGHQLGSGGCVVAFRMEVILSAMASYNPTKEHMLRSWVDDNIWQDRGLLSGGKSVISGALKEQYVTMVQAFLNNIDTSKKAVIKAAIDQSFFDAEAKTYWSNYKID